jgi:hypothetical protein
MPSRCPRVDGRFRPRGEHAVVGRPLRLAAEAPGEDPRERVEPVDGDGDLGQKQRRPVAAGHVGELVQQDDADGAARPSAARSRAGGGRDGAGRR